MGTWAMRCLQVRRDFAPPSGWEAIEIVWDCAQRAGNGRPGDVDQVADMQGFAVWALVTHARNCQARLRRGACRRDSSEPHTCLPLLERPDRFPIIVVPSLRHPFLWSKIPFVAGAQHDVPQLSHESRIRQANVRCMASGRREHGHTQTAGRLAAERLAAVSTDVREQGAISRQAQPAALEAP